LSFALDPNGKISFTKFLHSFSCVGSPLVDHAVIPHSLEVLLRAQMEKYRLRNFFIQFLVSGAEFSILRFRTNQKKRTGWLDCNCCSRGEFPGCSFAKRRIAQASHIVSNLWLKQNCSNQKNLPHNGLRLGDVALWCGCGKAILLKRCYASLSFQLFISKIKLSTTEIWVGRKKISVSDIAINQSAVPYFFNLNCRCISLLTDIILSRIFAAS
jgi:hypothetical protein